MAAAPASNPLPGRYASTLLERTEAGVRLLAECTGTDAEAHVRAFRRFYAQLDAGDIFRGATTPAEHTQLALHAALPVAHAFVLSYRGAELRGFGYLAEGRPRARLPESLGVQLETALALLLDGGGDRRDEAALLVDVFRLCYPNLPALAELPGASVAAQLGWVPAPGAHKLKIYFKTRIDTSVPHDRRIAEILTRLDLDDFGLYEALYPRDGATYFHGIGLDLDGDGTRRLKLYNHTPRDAAPSVIGALGARLQALGLPAEGVDEAAEELVASFDAAHIMREIELAVALRGDGPPTFKMSIFFHRDREPRVLEDATLALAARYGVERARLAALLEALTPTPQSGETVASSLTSVGIEVPLGAQPKLNVYLQPIF